MNENELKFIVCVVSHPTANSIDMFLLCQSGQNRNTSWNHTRALERKGQVKWEIQWALWREHLQHEAKLTQTSFVWRYGDFRTGVRVARAGKREKGRLKERDKLKGR